MRFAFILLSALVCSFCYAQNVGIGITTPAAPLHIRNSGPELFRLQGNNPLLSFFNNSGEFKGFLQAQGNNLNLGLSSGNTTGLVQFYTHNSLAMVIDPNSHVGIGTSFPGFKLTVETVGTGAGIVHRNSEVSVGTAVGLVSGNNGGWYGTFSNHPLFFFTNASAPQITLSQNGNVGIGYTTPLTKLDINGTLQATRIGIGSINPQGRLHITGGGNSVHLQGNGSFIYFCDDGNNPKGFVWNNGGNNMDLGTEVGNNSGEVKLTIRGTSGLTVQSDARVRVGATASTIPVFIAGVSNLPKLTISGALCIKDNLFAAADEWTIVSNSSIFGLQFFKNGGHLASVSEVSGAWVAVSDARLKENIRKYKPVLEDIQKLQICTYNYKFNGPDKRSFGLIAQNVAEYFPEVVSKINEINGEALMGISYDKTGVLAIKAIQEQQVIIETQQKNIESQQREIDELKKRLALLESKLK